MSFTISEQLYQQIAGNIGHLERSEIEGDEKLRRAAVAIVITSAPGSDEACILLTRRPVTLKRHSGQYALPGGMLDPGEDALQAGLREMEEEIGLSLEPTDVMGFLDDFGSRSGFCITPIVFWAGAGAVLDPAPEEVDVVFHIPLEELNHSRIPQMADVEGTEKPVFSAPLPTVGHEIYAPTAAMLFQFREVALRNEMIRVSHIEQPQFAWK